LSTETYLTCRQRHGS